MYTSKDLAKMSRGEKLGVIAGYVRREGGSPSQCLTDKEHESMQCKAARMVLCDGEIRMDSGQYWNGSRMVHLYLWAFYLNDKGQLCLQCGGRKDTSLSEAACYNPTRENDIEDSDLDKIILEWEI